MVECFGIHMFFSNVSWYWVYASWYLLVFWCWCVLFFCLVSWVEFLWLLSCGWFVALSSLVGWCCCTVTLFSLCVVGCLCCISFLLQYLFLSALLWVALFSVLHSCVVILSVPVVCVVRRFSVLYLTVYCCPCWACPIGSCLLVWGEGEGSVIVPQLVRCQWGGWGGVIVLLISVRPRRFCLGLCWIRRLGGCWLSILCKWKIFLWCWGGFLCFDIAKFALFLVWGICIQFYFLSNM